MNIVTPETPVADVAEFVRQDGYVVMRDALTPSQLDEISEAYDRQLALHPREAGAIRLELPRLIELDPAFEQFMDNPPVFAVVRELLGPTLELGTGGELDCKFGPTPAYIAWHADFQFLDGIGYPRQFGWVRCVYLIDDVTTDMGPFTFVPGSHGRGPAELAQYVGEDGQPLPIEGQVPLVGPAGSCLINNTDIWHTNTANTGPNPRRLAMMLYKPGWMKQWDKGYDITDEFASRQTDPVRRQLCGLSSWTDQDPSLFPAASWQPRMR